MNICSSYKSIFFVLSLLLFSESYAQTHDEHTSRTFKKDSIEVEKQIVIIDSLYDNDEFSKALSLLDNVIPFCENIGISKQISRLYRTKGDIYRTTDNYIKALESLSTSLEHYRKAKDTSGIAGVINRIGAVYRLQGNYPNALENYFESLKIYQSISLKRGISSTLNNIGIVYLYQKEYDKALEYYINSLKIEQERNNEDGILISYINIGQAYTKKGDLSKAIDYYLKALMLSKKNKDLDATGVNYNEIGAIYTNLNNLNQAIYFLNEALATFTKLGSRSRLSECYIYLGQYYAKINDNKQAISHFNKALEFAKQAGSKEFYANALENLSSVYERAHQPDQALKYYKNFIIARDSLINQESTKRSVQAELLYQFERKQGIQKLEQAKKDAILLEKAKQQKVFRNFLIAILSLLIILITFILSAYKNKKRANEILAVQQREILEKNEELLQQQEEILSQRDEIEMKNSILERSQQIIAAKNDRIISSIEYAQTIQQAILPKEDQLNKFFKDHFVIFMPKDIVSGDFFWFSADKDIVFAAVIDCTGHGVPGSFMSLIGNTLLNQIVNEWHTHDPALILEYLHEKVRKALQQDETNSKAHASMDICFVKINTKTHKVTFAGANRPLYIVENGILVKHQGDKKSAGGFQRETRRYFTNNEINLSGNATLYLTTDGYIDQMNTEKKKFGPNQLLNLLETNSDKPMVTQKELLVNMFEVFRNGEEQIDDICILGLKV